MKQNSFETVTVFTTCFDVREQRCESVEKGGINESTTDHSRLEGSRIPQ